ncbi:hypothetical protein SELMODRAFT_138285 [Selaginella moellendorffii]|uniref:Major facilitator superfamily (MFS) profile domain-containing protein n=1 Tax=Selaginella moellendorffii TaxID=88036 RepID=D8TEZ5_SELML|nr:protein NRT1/ PTR FAMILY 8.1 [Selaginella moellendorffii]EFJ04754.1 hypothetical protein SELMODRAFT_138285 [Selaginella moellendorffii]|eukprot:XP_002994164.1 protein NRT1/ PTR FAMILY 8.1 [Selaginella moellendorffii]
MSFQEDNQKGKQLNREATGDGTLDLFGRPAVKCKTGGWFTSSLILGTQGFAAVGYFGVCTNLILYLTRVLHEGNAVAANNVSNWIGTSYVTSLIGGFLGDAYLGRFWTAAVFLVIYLLGMVLLTLTATVKAFKPPACTRNQSFCPKTSPEKTTLLYVALYIIALGYGGHQPCLTSLGADQFDKEDPKEQTEATRFFSWYYMSITFGAITAGVLFVYVEDNIGWGVGFGLSTAAAVAAVVAFFIGAPRYRQQRTGGNPFTRVAQVFNAALHKHHVKAPSDSSLLYEVDFKGSAIQGSRKILHSDEFRYLDKAATEIDSDTVAGTSEKNPWRLCTITQVEEVKCILRILPIWASSILFSTLYTQMSTLFVEQGATMNTHVAGFKIPPASLSTFTMISVLLSAPTYEYVVVPLGRKITGNKRGLTSLQRMGAGLIVVTVAMIFAALVEIFRLKSARAHGLIDAAKPVPMSVFWQIPQYFLVGASEVFTYIGQLDFFYEQSPDAIRSLSVALSPTSFALGNYVSSLLVTCVMELTSKGARLGWIPNNLNRGHLDYYFWLLSAISILNLAFYLACAIWYKFIQIDRHDDAAREEP